MLRVLREQINHLYKSASSSIWFFPTLISLAYLLFVIVLLSVHTFSAIHTFVDYIPWLNFQSINTPRSILTTLIASVISLMVLSFSMVMVVLGQAASNFSPKILMGLVSEKSHQVVLGNYLGTTIYSLILLLGFHKSKSYELASIGVLIGIAFGIWCLILFVYFIHKTSQSIQINYIIDRIYYQTERRLKIKAADREDLPVLDQALLDDKGQQLKSSRSGYIQNWNKSALENIASREHIIIRFDFQPGDYVVKGLPVISILNADSDIDDDLAEAIMDELVFFDGERISENYYYGFTQLMEIAIKALSPSLNDPGTARLCIHNLTDLFRLKMEAGDTHYSCDDEKNVLLIWHSFSFESLLYKAFAPIRDYGAADISICLSLLKAYKTLAALDKEEKYKQLLQEHAEAVLAAIAAMKLHAVDKAFIEPRISEHSHYLQLSLHTN